MDKRRAWLSVAIQQAMTLGMLTEEEAMRHFGPSVLAAHLPRGVLASLLQAGLESDVFDASLVLQKIGLDALPQHIPISLLWRCVCETGRSLVTEEAQCAPRQRSEKQGVRAANEDQRSDLRLVQR
jgi:hypothetical protein